ncbi:hypothetical protein CNBL2870 [Cryptococcus deneoformans B-3501A]|uniref:hypothetical protein n=1 Tax=Cryptococcus deneoformans (strain B-3501A) TaxID=283643 RepID=UPI000042F477|nr:hypothetical protein CNBL2870 [Cryptococcus neoformans var. neoformans B-3501A]EAL17774.1 hypothetical protein CNBL2870 [Cryptococcus neoformans var. neoformans B-3501A]
MTALSSSLHRDNQQSLPRRASSKSDRGLASGAPNVSISSSTASQSTLGDYNLEDEELPYSETLEKKKRKYSEKLYQWTQEMWNNTKQDMDRRSSVSSSEDSADFYKAHNESK